MSINCTTILCGLLGLLLGVTAGWYLRPRAAWCAECGGALACRLCGHRPGILPSSVSSCLASKGQSDSETRRADG
jgi:hypothetical protein